MSEIMQNRPMNSGLPVLCPPAGTVVHTCDSTAADKGGPLIDEVTLYVVNGDAAAQVARIVIGVGQAIDIELAGNAVVKVLDKHPIRSSGATITVANTTNNGPMVAYGSFTRS